MNDAEQPWREAVSAAQAIAATLEAEFHQLTTAIESCRSRASALSDSTVSLSASYEDSVVRASRLLDVTTRGVENIRRALIAAANESDDLRRVLDFYHH